jgi:hypothetical protein
MKRWKFTWWILGILLAGSAWTGTGRAQDFFSVTPSHVEIPERGQVESLQILESTNIFSIIPPLGWRLRVNSAQRRLDFISTNQFTSISVQFVGTNAALAPTVDLDALSSSIESRFPEGKIKSHFRSVTGFVPGEGFDLSWRAESRQVLYTRISLIPYDCGTVEVSLTGSQDSMEDHRFTYTGLLNSFTREWLRRVQ